MTVYGGLQTGYREKPPGYITIDGDRLIDLLASIIVQQGQITEEIRDLLDMMSDAMDSEKEVTRK